MRILVLHGPNLSRAFLRDLPGNGPKDVETFSAWLEEQGSARKIQVEFARYLEEGVLCQTIGDAQKRYDALIVNFGLLRYTSLPLWGAIRECELPCVEVVPTRERLPMERAPLVPRACLASVSGMGLFSYQAALDFLIRQAAQGQKKVVTRHSDR